MLQRNTKAQKSLIACLLSIPEETILSLKIENPICSLFYLSRIYSEYLMCNPKTGQIYSDNFAIRVLQLRQIETDEARNKYPDLYYWAKLFVAETWEEINMLATKSEGLHEAVVTFAELSEDDKIKEQCLARDLYEGDIASAKRSGERIGEKKAQMEIVHNMLADNLPIETISKYSGLTPEEIRLLQK